MPPRKVNGLEALDGLSDGSFSVISPDDKNLNAYAKLTKWSIPNPRHPFGAQVIEKLAQVAPVPETNAEHGANVIQLFGESAPRS